MEDFRETGGVRISMEEDSFGGKKDSAPGKGDAVPEKEDGALEKGYSLSGERQGARRRRPGGKPVLTAVLLLISLCYIYPLLVTFASSFMSQEEVARNYSIFGDILHPGEKYVDMNLIPERVTLSQYRELLLESPVYLNMFWNSVKIALPVAAGQLLVSSMAAYAFTVLRFRGKELLYFLYIIVMLLPLQVTLLPNYLTADWLHIKDSYLAVILPGIFHPLGTFLLRQSLKSLPEAYLEAARMDGAGHMRIFCGIVLPLSKSALAAVVMLTLIDYWNLIDQAVIFIQDAWKQPLSMALADINVQAVGVAFGGACFYAFPILLLLLWGQDYLREGIGLSGIKA